MGGGSKAQTLGYRYFFTLQMGVGRGPINELIEIRVGDKLAWFGSATSSGSIYIGAGSLFGGDKGEGGIEGTMDICMGEPTQGQNSMMVKMRGALLSAYRGVTTFVYDGLVCSMNPYPKPWRFRVRRTTAGWDRAGGCWYPERADIYYYDDYTALESPQVAVGYVGNPDFYTKEQWKEILKSHQINMAEEVNIRRRTINAMNPAHILVEIATNREWGRGMPDDQIDWTSFKLAADTLYCEKFGICMRWNRQSSIDEVVGEIINTIGAFQYVSRSTGKLTIRMVRSDYDVDALPVFTRTSGILSIESNESSGSDAGFNEVVVKWKSPLNGKMASVRYQNLGSAMSDGGINSETTEYLTVPDRNLALRLAARDVKSSTGDISRLKITFDRRGWPLEPGVVFVLSDPDSGIGQMVMRVVTVENEDYVKGTITVSCLTDIFGLPETTYVGGLPPVDGGDDTPEPTLDDQMIEIPYRSIYQNLDRANFEILDPATVVIGGVAARPNLFHKAFELRTRAEGEPEWGEDAEGTWTDWATLRLPLRPLDTIAYLNPTADWDDAKNGDVAMIGKEQVKVVTIDRVNMTLLLERGCLDTVPDRHNIGDRFWFYDTGSAVVEREFVAGETVLGKFLPYTSSNQLLESYATMETVKTVGRFGSPYVPGLLKLNGVSVYETYELTTDTEVTWARCNRVTQMDTVVDHTQPDILPEVGQTVSIKLFRADTDAVLATWDTLADTSATINTTYGGEVRMEVFSVRDTFESYDRYNTTFGYDGIHLVMVDGSLMLTQENDLIITQE